VSCGVRTDGRTQAAAGRGGDSSNPWAWPEQVDYSSHPHQYLSADHCRGGSARVGRWTLDT